MNKLKITLKKLFLTKEGWFSWIFANIITSLPWFLPLAYGFVFQDERGYIASAAVYAFILAPFTPFWMLNVLLALASMKYIFRKEIKHEQN
jgi:hypothetical protein